jgi:hypothetical protein
VSEDCPIIFMAGLYVMPQILSRYNRQSMVQIPNTDSDVIRLGESLVAHL